MRKNKAGYWKFPLIPLINKKPSATAEGVILLMNKFGTK